MDGFFKQVHAIVAKIPKGKVATYGQIAKMLGDSKGARTVGWAMQCAPEGLPCHRVVNKSGKLAPSYVFGSSDRQRFLLEIEGITFDIEGCIDMKKHLWDGVME